MGVGILPVFAQSLLACRIARRAALAMLEGGDLVIAMGACDVIESSSQHGKLESNRADALGAIAKIGRSSNNEAVRLALSFAAQALAAAEDASPTSDDHLVTELVQQCIDAVASDPRISQTQFAIILHSDIDQIRFACAEAKVARYDGVGDDVLGRLVPCHAFQLFEPRRPIEDQYR